MSSPSAVLRANKKQLRAILQQRLSNIGTESIAAQSKVVFERLQDLPVYREACRISIFLSMPQSEIQTDSIVRHAFANGKQVFVPYLHRRPSPKQRPDDAAEALPTRLMDMVRLRDLADYDCLRPDRWGIPSVHPADVGGRERILPESDVTEDVPALDLILMPGVAFREDVRGNGVRRLGHGRGFYDYFIHRYRVQHERDEGKKGVSLYGLALAEQILGRGGPEGRDRQHLELELPVGPLDCLLHGVIVGDCTVMVPKLG